MKVFDKAQWHIDAGEDSKEVVAKFKAVFEFLNNRNMLSAEGKEFLEFGIDSSTSLNERMVTKEGIVFLYEYYDKVINCKAAEIREALEKIKI